MPDLHAGARAPIASPRHGRSPWIAAIVCAAAMATACGKKGPPLPPLLNVPVAPQTVTAKRAGDEVTIRFTIPQSNQSGVHPANLERMEVYAWTPAVEGLGSGRGDANAATGSGERTSAGSAGGPRGSRGAAGGAPPGRAAGARAPRAAEVTLTADEVVKHAKLVATVPVRQPPPPPPERKEDEPPPPPPPPPTGPGLDQGAVAQVTDTITPADREPIVLKRKEPKLPKPPEGAERDITLTPPDVGPPLPPLPSRLYVVVGVNRHGRRGAMSPPLRVPLWDPPPAPTDLTATVREGAVDLTWSRPEGLRHPLVTNLAPAPTRTGSGGAAGTAPSTTPGAVSGGAVAPGGLPGGVPPPGAAPGTPAPGATAEAPSRPIDEDDEDAAADADAQAKRDAAMNAAAQARSMAAQASGVQPPTEAPPAGSPTAPAGAQSTPMLDPSVAATLPSRPLYPWPASGAGFVVYEVQSQDASHADIPPPPAVQPFPRPLTTAPQPTATFTDARLEYGVTRCYAVRTSETVGTLSIESAASRPACISAKDVFAPAAPRSLGAVSSEGAISLIWEGNTEPDLAGYIVLRGVNGGPLQPITPSPIRETTFRDTTVRRGTRYTYAVVALDTATPQNRSAESNRVEETAR